MYGEKKLKEWFETKVCLTLRKKNLCRNRED